MTVVVRVEPAGVDIEVADGENLMAAAQRQGYKWPTVCHGLAVCTACFIDVTGQDDAFDPVAPLELEGLKGFAGMSFYEGKTLRLACQARPRTNLTITKRGVKPVE